MRDFSDARLWPPAEIAKCVSVFKMRKLMLEIRSVWNCKASQLFQGLSEAEIALLSFVTQLRRSIVGWIRAFLQMLC